MKEEKVEVEAVTDIKNTKEDQVQDQADDLDDYFTIIFKLFYIMSYFIL